MIPPTAAELQQSMLLMKLTPYDIGHVTSELFRADEQTLKMIPQYAYQHYFDEIGITFLNWMGQGQSKLIDETLRSLSYTVFNSPDMHRLPELTPKQHIGLHLRALSAQMTLHLKVQSSVSYTALLVGDRNRVRRGIVRVLYESALESTGFGLGALAHKDICRRVLQQADDRITSDQNVHHHLRELAIRGLLVEERTGGRVMYRLSERGVHEAQYHFEQGKASIKQTVKRSPVREPEPEPEPEMVD